MIENTTDSARSLTSASPILSNQPGTRWISIEVSSVEGVIFVKLSGTPRPEAIVKMLDDLNTLIANDSSLCVLIDETGLNPGLAGPGDIGRFVGAWRRAPALRSSRMGIFVSNLAMYGLNRMFEGLADSGGHMSVFRDRAGAVAWLSEGRVHAPSAATM